MSLEQLSHELGIEHSYTVHKNLEQIIPELRFAETVELRYVKDKSYRQIAAMTNISHTAAKDHIAYTLELLKLPSIIKFLKGESKSTADTLLTHRVPIRLAAKLEELNLTDKNDLIDAINSKHVKKREFTSQQREKLSKLCEVEI